MRRRRQAAAAHGPAASLALGAGARRGLWAFFVAFGMFAVATAAPRAEEPAGKDEIRRLVDRVVGPLMAAHDVPGVAVGVTAGDRAFVFNYGLASREERRPVDDATIFEIGSLSKTFTATLGAYAAELGALSLEEPAERRLPDLEGAPLGSTPLRDLATYSAGGLPLQFPDGLKGREAMIDWFRAFRPMEPVGRSRRYSNPSIGLFGLAVAASLGTDFQEAMERRLFPALGLSRTFIDVPPGETAAYAFGYAKAEKPIRVNPGLLDAEAYGVKTTAADLLRFLQAGIDPSRLEPPLRRAIEATQSGYLVAGPMTQGLGWEIYAEPNDLGALIAGNAPAQAFEANPATRLDPPSPPRADALYAKTGSTNGFGAFAAFVPARRIGVVVLANRNYPIEARLRAAHAILTALDRAGP